MYLCCQVFIVQREISSDAIKGDPTSRTQDWLHDGGTMEGRDEHRILVVTNNPAELIQGSSRVIRVVEDFTSTEFQEVGSTTPEDEILESQ